ncbi:hypothetical protein LXL04_025956 [Taraxacum kok-saghyz]
MGVLTSRPLEAEVDRSVLKLGGVSSENPGIRTGILDVTSGETPLVKKDTGLSPDRVRHQTVLPNAQTKDRVRHLRQNLSLRLFKADRVRRKITDSGPSPTSNAHYQTHRLRTESVY